MPTTEGCIRAESLGRCQKEDHDDNDQMTSKIGLGDHWNGIWLLPRLKNCRGGWWYRRPWSLVLSSEAATRLTWVRLVAFYMNIVAFNCSKVYRSQLKRGTKKALLLVVRNRLRYVVRKIKIIHRSVDHTAIEITLVDHT